MFFFGNSLGKSILKKIVRLLNGEHPMRGVLKTSAFKTCKSGHQEVFPKIGVLKIQTSHIELHII